MEEKNVNSKIHGNASKSFQNDKIKIFHALCAFNILLSYTTQTHTHINLVPEEKIGKNNNSLTKVKFTIYLFIFFTNNHYSA